MNSKEKALELCREIALTTLFAKDCNDGYTLPLRVVKIIAIKFVDEILNEIPTELLDTYKGEINLIKNERYYFWFNVRSEIHLLIDE
jgi:hypothetical protein